MQAADGLQELLSDAEGGDQERRIGIFEAEDDGESGAIYRDAFDSVFPVAGSDVGLRFLEDFAGL
jgi:hypothetical protein